MGSTAEVVKRHLGALIARDLDGILKDYAQDAVMMTNQAPVALCGRAALRAFWTQALAVFTPQVLGEMNISQQLIEKDVAFIVWSAGQVMPFGSDTFIVHDGKIVSQTAAVQIAGQP